MSDSLDAYRQTAHELLAERGLDGAFSLHVTGYSMTPLLWPGDLVRVHSVPLDELRPGDIIVVRRLADPGTAPCGQDTLKGRTITHRLIAIGAGTWHTRGDSCYAADPPVPGAAIMGRVTGFERAGVRVDLTRPRWLAVNRWLGRLGRAQAAIARRWRVDSAGRPALIARLAAWLGRVLLRAAIKLMLIGETRRV